VRRHTTRWGRAGLAAAIGATVAACSSPEGGAAAAFVLNGEAVSMDRIVPALGEAAGGEVVREAALDLLLAAELERRGLSVTAADIATERRLFEEGAAGSGRLEDVAAARGLGPVRLAGLLRRNAGLRKLAGDEAVSEAEASRAIAEAFGPTVRARLVITPTEREAAKARAAVMNDPAGPVAGMAAAAFSVSIDPSAAVGGLFDGVSPTDRRWPGAIADRLRTLEPGGVGPVTSFEGGAALVLVESRSPGRAPSAEEASRVRREVASRRQAEAMRSVAQELLRGADLSVVEPSLRWSAGR